MANKNFKVKNGITILEPLALTEGGLGVVVIRYAI